MMNRTLFIKLLLVASAAAAICSCTRENLVLSSEDCGVADAVSSKLVHTSDNAVQGELLVYFHEDAISTIEGVPTRSGAAGVATRSGITEFDAVLQDIGVKSIQRLFPVNAAKEEATRASGLHRWYIVAFDDASDLDDAARKMAAVADVALVEFNRQLKRIDDSENMQVAESRSLAKAAGTGFFNDPDLAYQWGYINNGDKNLFSGIKAGADVNCEEAWKLCTGDPRVIVAIVDGGIQWNHPDLEANMWTNFAELNGLPGVDDDGNGYVDDIHGRDFVHNAPQKLPGDDHGTHVAGTVAAVNNNGTGGCGVAGGSGNGDGVRLMSCQIFSGKEGGNVAATSKAIKYAADNGASVLQCSFGIDGGGVTSDKEYEHNYSAEKAAIDFFANTKNCAAVDGGIVVFAAGNEAYPMSGYPGGYHDYISVTAMSCDFTPAYYTNYGPGCNIAAPGGDQLQSYIEDNDRTSGSKIYSTLTEGGYGWMQGTSMACPHVSGVAALGLSYALKLGKTFTRNQFNALLLTSVNNIDQYCTGTKNGLSGTNLITLDLSGYRGMMGTGYIDAYQVLMNVRGITCIPASVGRQTTVEVKKYIGDGNAACQVKAVKISDEDKDRLGISSDPTVFGGNILLKCSKPGSAVISIELVAGVGNDGMSGKTIVREFALIARESHSDNGGWL